MEDWGIGELENQGCMNQDLSLPHISGKYLLILASAGNQPIRCSRLRFGPCFTIQTLPMSIVRSKELRPHMIWCDEQPWNSVSYEHSMIPKIVQEYPLRPLRAQLLPRVCRWRNYGSYVLGHIDTFLHYVSRTHSCG